MKPGDIVRTPRHITRGYVEFPLWTGDFMRPPESVYFSVDQILLVVTINSTRVNEWACVLSSNGLHWVLTKQVEILR